MNETENYIPEELLLEEALFFERFGELIASEVPLLRAIQVAGEEIKNINLRNIIRQIKRKLEQGTSIADSFREYPNYFSEFVLAILETGEQRGLIETSLFKLAEYLRRQIITQRETLSFKSSDTASGDVKEIEHGEKLFSEILQAAIRANASHIYFEPTENNVEVKLKKEKDISFLRYLTHTEHNAILAKISSLIGKDLRKSVFAGDLSLTSEPGVSFQRIFVECLTTQLGPKLTCQIFYKESLIPEINSLISLEHLNLLKLLMQFTNGLIFIVGSPRHEKSILAYSLLKEIKKQDFIKNIFTIERGLTPLYSKEFFSVHIGNGENNLRSIKEALFHIYKYSPDLIFIDEIRDLEECKAIFEGALSGYLIIAALDAETTYSAITKLSTFGLSLDIITQGIRGIITLRTVKKICQNCKKMYNPSSQELRLLPFSSKKMSFYSSGGCSICQEPNYIPEKITLYEILLFTPRIRELLLEKKNWTLIEKEAQALGTIPIRAQALKLAKNGEISFNELIKILC